MKRFAKITFIFLFALAVGVFGVQSVGAQTLPAGCTTTNGYSTSSGVACNGVTTSTVSGCTSPAGFSTVNGQPCNGLTIAGNGSTGAAYTTFFPAGCTSASGFSTVNGVACTTGVVTYLNGCSGTLTGFSTSTGLACSLASGINAGIIAGANTGTGTGGTGTGTPGLPSTGAGGNALMNIALLLVAGGIAAVGATYLSRRFATK
jgi:hypothetical protein